MKRLYLSPMKAFRVREVVQRQIDPKLTIESVTFRKSDFGKTYSLPETDNTSLKSGLYLLKAGTEFIEVTIGS